MFLGLNGRPAIDDVERKLDALKAGGVNSFMVYPVSVLKLEYLGQEFFEIVRAFAAGAKRRNMKMWLYDEYNWPSGTCKGRVPAESDEFKLVHLTVATNGQGYAWSRTFARPADVGMISGNGKKGWTNLLEPQAVRRFLALTHEAYARELKPFFEDGTIRGMFTDEPFHMAPIDLPPRTAVSFRTYDGIEEDYGRLTGGRNLHADVEAWISAGRSSETAGVWADYNTLYARKFRSSYFDQIREWAVSHGVQSTGHMISEDNLAMSTWMNGDPLETLSGLTLPGMDEIYTQTVPDKIQWLTLHTVQYAIRKNGHGGMAELFALGPADLTPGECLKMIHLCALHGVTRYFTVMSTMDASWMDEMRGFTVLMGDQQPWFAEFPSFIDAADAASALASKRAIFDVAVRFPRRQAALAYMKSAQVPPVNRLIRTLECAQVGVELIREEDETSAQVVFAFEGESMREERTGRRFANSVEACEWALAHVPQRFVLRDENGERVKDVIVRNYADGSSAYLRLGPDPSSGNGGRALSIDGEWALTLSAMPTLRLPFGTNGVCRLTLEIPMDGLCCAARKGGGVFVDGRFVPVEDSCDVLRPSFNQLYGKSKPFSLAAGEHEFRLPKGQVDDNWYLPAAFLAGNFAERNGRLSPRPQTVAPGALSAQGLAGFCGTASYSRMVEVPSDGGTRLRLNTGGHFAHVWLDGKDLGAIGWGDFEWPVPEIVHGRRVELKIAVYTSILPLFGSATPPPSLRNSSYRGTRAARPCGLLAAPEWRLGQETEK